MKLNKRLQAFVDKAKQSDSYWVEKVKLAFAVALDRRRREAGITSADLAKKVGTSPAYITKVFRGDSNFTIETMVKLVRATGGRLEISVVDAEAPAVEWASRRVDSLLAGHMSSRSYRTGASDYSVAANNDQYYQSKPSLQAA